VARDSGAVVGPFWLRLPADVAGAQEIVRRIASYGHDVAYARRGWLAARGELERASSDAKRSAIIRTPCEPNGWVVATAAAHRASLIARKIHLTSGWERVASHLVPSATPWRDAKVRIGLVRQSLSRVGRASLHKLRTSAVVLASVTHDVAAALKAEGRLGSSLRLLATQLHAARSP
jgi:hypothetical protein